MKQILSMLFAFLAPTLAVAFCDPPFPPDLTSEAIAREFREEFRSEFEAYFSDVQAYIGCVDEERARVMAEADETVRRYERFLEANEIWGVE